MGLLDPTPPPYAPLEWVKKPLSERARMVCEAWAMQGYGTPVAVYFAYVIKVALYVGAWIAFCKTSPALGGPTTIARWWLNPIAFEKAIVWSLLFEVLGLGCGSGPLTGRYSPPLGGALYFLRPGTTKLPLVPGLPVLGGRTRSVLDALMYAALVALSVRALIAAEPGPEHFVPLAVLVPILGVADKTIFLAARAEHFWVTIVCFAVTPSWIASAQLVQIALWFFAGFSKLNHHFPTVACVMTSNGPFTRMRSLRRAMYQDFPRDLRPSRLASIMAHGGTLLEFGVPIVFLLSPLGVKPVAAIVLMLALHVYITSNVPMGVPIEWNVVVVYAGFALFWAHPDVRPWMMAPPALAAFVVFMSLVLPVYGNFFPSRISFLLSMRYYAGNWAYSVWLLEKGAHEKLARLKGSSPWIYEQLARYYDEPTSIGLFGKVMAFRMMHLHGRALPLLVPKALGDRRLEDYEWIDGEIVAGIVLGWNFGEGHLHQEQLLEAVQAQCKFDEGEVRCVFVESQPMLGKTMEWRIADAARGVIARGELDVEELRTRQPWEAKAAR
jgi:hypothetical protein